MTFYNFAALTTAFLLAFGSASARLGSIANNRKEAHHRDLRENCSGSSMLNGSLQYRICDSSQTTLCWKAVSGTDVVLETYDGSLDSFKFSFVNQTFHYIDSYVDGVKIYSHDYSTGDYLEARDLDDNDGQEKFKVSVGDGNSCSLSHSVKFSYYDDDILVNKNKWLNKSGSGFNWKDNSGDGSLWKIIEV